MNNKDFKTALQEVAKRNSIGCFYANYELIRWKIEEEVNCD